MSTPPWTSELAPMPSSTLPWLPRSPRSVSTESASGSEGSVRGVTLLDLPDELLIRILSYLPTACDLTTAARTCRHLHAISQQATLWSHLFYVSGFRLRPDLAKRIVATPTAPGEWRGRRGRRFVRTGEADPEPAPAAWRPWTYLRELVWPTSSSESDETPVVDGWLSSLDSPDDRASIPMRLPATADGDGPIPVHFPTLFRARCYVDDELRGAGPLHPFRSTLGDPDGDDLSSDASELVDASLPAVPNFLWSIEAHSGKVYSVVVRDHWVVSSGRDRELKVWRLPSLSLDGRMPEWGPNVVCTVPDAHEGSVLCTAFEEGDAVAGVNGALVTGSSDMAVKVWDVVWGTGKGDNWDSVKVELKTKLTGHTGKVAAVAMSKQFIVTGSHDRSVRIYDRESCFADGDAQLLRTFTLHRGSITSIALHPDPDMPLAATVGLDGRWRIIDLRDGARVRDGGDDGRGYGCVDWQVRAVLWIRPRWRNGVGLVVKGRWG